MRKSLKTLVATLFLISVVAGLAVAATNTMADKTMKVSDDTRSVYAEIENTSNGNATVVVYGVDEDGFNTELKNQTVSAPGANETVMVEQSVNATKYPKYRVMVNGETENTTAESINIGTLMEVSGGSGGFDLGNSENLGIGAVVVFLAGVLYLRD